MKRLIKANYKTLIIVDIQKNFSNFFDDKYLNQVENIINQGWNNIITIVDDIDGKPEIPDFIYEASNEIIPKQYGGWEQMMFDEYIESGEMEIIEENEVYKYKNNLIIKGNIHEYFEIPKDMELVFKELQEATIIGGGDQECLDDIENALIYLNVKVKRNSSGIYGAYSKSKNNYWIDEINWIEV